MRVLLAALLFTVVACSSGGGGGGGNVDPRCNCKATPAAEVKNAHPQQGPIVVIGDSLATGYGSDNGSMFTPAACLGNAFGSQVQMLAEDGNTTSGVYNIVYQVKQMKPSLVFVSTGGNDAIIEAQKAGQYPEAKSLREMKHVMEGLVSSGALVVYLGLRPPQAGGDRLYKMWDMATSKGVVVVDGMDGMWSNDKMMSDEFHPNEKGYEAMCGKILESIKGYYP